MADEADRAPAGEPEEIEWQFDALDLRPVERWLAALARALRGGTCGRDRHGAGPAHSTTGRHLPRHRRLAPGASRVRPPYPQARPSGGGDAEGHAARRGERPASTTRSDRAPASRRGVRSRRRRSRGPPVARRRRRAPTGRGAPGTHPPAAVRVARRRRRRGGGGARRHQHRGGKRPAAHDIAPRRGRGPA